MNTKNRHASKGGRPAKFAEPSSRVTVTLPVRTLGLLAAISDDRAKAIARAVDAAAGLESCLAAETSILRLPFGPNESILAVPDNSLLRAISWISLVEIMPGRFLIVISGDETPEKFEVALGDILETPPHDATQAEIETVLALLKEIREPRRRQSLSLKSLLVVASR